VDIQMPVMDGYMATKKIRSLEDSDLANIPIIALSANAFGEDRKASTDAGMNGHLEKPVNVSELLKMLCKLF
jgi:CheY-like chemotaxis protein